MKHLVLIISCFALISCSSEEEPTTKYLISNENVEGLEQKRSGLVSQIEELRNELGLVTGAHSTAWIPPKNGHWFLY